ncbi:MAG: reverse transcriptase domain-containing protein, partial [Propionibacteriaceae bacterium]
MTEYAEDLLQKGAIARVNRLKFQGRLFSVPKKGSQKRRVILDLSRLNLAIRCDKFKMLTISQVRTLLPRGAVTTSIDLTDAYYHIPIARHFRPYLGFKIGDQTFSFKVVPFGLNVAPRVFTKLAEVVVQQLRAQGIMVVAYLDDWLIWAPSVEECNKATLKVIQFLEYLGFKINRSKSRLTPESNFQWLGIQWNLSSHTLSIPSTKRKEIAKSVKQFLSHKLASRRAQERILGSLQFASVTNILMKAKLKDLTRIWRSRANVRSRDKLSSVPLILKNRLRPWAKVKNLSVSVPLQFPPPGITIHTDASLSGWGGYSQVKKVQGIWSPQFRQFHINVL